MREANYERNQKLMREANRAETAKVATIEGLRGAMAKTSDAVVKPRAAKKGKAAKKKRKA
jgi:hypothetical protein